MPLPDRAKEILESEQIVERLAAIEHDRWASWQRYVHEHCERTRDGSLLIPASLVARWETQIDTPYAALSEHQKDSDREQVQRYLPTIIDALSSY